MNIIQADGIPFILIFKETKTVGPRRSACCAYWVSQPCSTGFEGHAHEGKP